MRRGKVKKILISAGLLLLASSFSFGQDTINKGIVVESVKEGSVCDKAGFQEGQKVLSWIYRDADGSAVDSGYFTDIFDWLIFLREYIPRGEVEITVLEKDKLVTLKLDSDSPEMIVVPAVSLEIPGYCSPPESTDGAKGSVEDVISDLIEKSFNRVPDVTVCWMLQSAGRKYMDRAEFREAELCFKKALEILEGLEGRNIEETLLTIDLCTLFQESGNIPEAGKYLEKALREIKDLMPGSLHHAMVLAALSTNQWFRDELDESEKSINIALEILDRLNPVCFEKSSLLVNKAGIAWKKGDLKTAEEGLKESLKIQEQLSPDELGLAGILSNWAIIAARRGDLENAYKRFKRALEIRERLEPDSPILALSLINIAGIAFYRMDYDLARDYYKRAYNLQKEIAPESITMAAAMSNLGKTADEAGDLEEAEKYFLEAFELRQRLTGNSLDLASSLTSLGKIAEKKKEYSRAESFYLRAMKIHESIPGNSELKGLLLENMAVLEREKGNYDKCYEYLQEGLEIIKSQGPESVFESQLCNTMALTYIMQGEYEKAFVYLEQAVNANSSEQKKLGGGNQASERFSERNADSYRLLADIQFLTGRENAVFDTVESFRAKALLSMIAERDISFSEDLGDELLEEGRKLSMQYNRLQSKLRKVDPQSEPDNYRQVEDELSKLRLARKKHELKIIEKSPRLAALESSESLSSQDCAGILDEDTLLVSYCTAPEGILVCSILNGEMLVRRVEISRDKLTRKVNVFRRLVSDPSTERDNLTSVAMDLYDLLMKPISVELGKSKKVIICPDGPLHYLPFSALETKRNKPLILKKPVQYVISATVYSELRNYDVKADELFAAFGNPVYEHENVAPLPYSGDEAKEVTALFEASGNLYLGKDAGKDNALMLNENYSYIHFACHGLINEKFPLESGLLLSPDKEGSSVLQVWEIFENLRLNADLVTLSACETGLGKEMGGEGLIGLTRAFQYAGAKTVMSSLWSVSDKSTVILMKSFYAHLKQGKSKAVALKLAQKEMVKSKEYSHPFYWAGFILNGA